MEQELANAIQSGAWYPILGVSITLLVAIAKRLQPVWFGLIPTRWQWIPAIVIAALGSFTVAYENGETWLVAVIGAITAGLTAIGAHHTVKRVAGKNGVEE
jgi:hypothetical protein